MRSLTRWKLLTATLLIWIAAQGLATAGEGGAANERRDLDLASFDHVWTTIRDTYWDPKLGGLDWDAVRSELRPKVEQAESTGAARAVMSEAIARLGQSHFAILPATMYDELAEPGAEDAELGGEGVTGIDLRVVDGVAIVTGVAPGSSAEAAGVRPGWVVLAAGGKELGPVIARVSEQYPSELGREVMLVMALDRRLEGEPGGTVDLRLLDGSDREVALKLELRHDRGRRVEIGYLPPMYVWLDVRRTPDNVGVIAFNAFADPTELMTRFGEAVQSFADADGIVLDLRGNLGGIGGMAMGMAGWFVRQAGRQLGTMTTRDARIAFAVFPRPQAFNGPLAVLVDGVSASTSEILAGGLQDLGRARVFGQRTAGMALPSRVDRLPNGDGFQYAIANYVSSGGEPLEGRGVTPDGEVAPTRAALLEGRDPALEAAVRWVKAERRAAAAAQ